MENNILLHGRLVYLVKDSWLSRSTLWSLVCEIERTKKMTEEKLVASIREKMPDFQISLSDLRTPTPKFVQNYFIRFLEELDVNVESFQLIEKQMAKMTCPNSIVYVVPLTQLFGAVNKIAKHIFIKDFGLHDLTRPKPKRILNILNHFDSFHTYADMLAEHFQYMMKELLDRKKQYKELLIEVKSLNEEVRHQSNMRGLNEVLRQEIEELKKKRLAQKQQKMSKIVKKMVEVDSTVEKLEMKQQKVSSEYDEVNDEVTKLHVHVVHSPEADHMELRLHNLEKKRTESEKRIKELQNSVQKKIAQINLFKKCISDHEQGTHEMHTFVEVATQNKMFDEKIQTLEKSKLAAGTKEVDVMEKSAKLTGKLKRLNEQKRILKTEMEKELAEIKKETDETEKKVAKQRQKAACYVDLKKKISEMEKEIEKKVQDHDKMCHMYDEMFDEKISELNAQLDEIIRQGIGEL